MKILESTVTKKVTVYFYNFCEKTFKNSTCCNISNFYDGFVWNPSKVQRWLAEQIARFLEVIWRNDKQSKM